MFDPVDLARAADDSDVLRKKVGLDRRPALLLRREQLLYVPGDIARVAAMYVDEVELLLAAGQELPVGTQIGSGVQQLHVRFNLTHLASVGGNNDAVVVVVRRDGHRVGRIASRREQRGQRVAHLVRAGVFELKDLKLGNVNTLELQLLDQAFDIRHVLRQPRHDQRIAVRVGRDGHLPVGRAARHHVKA